MAIKTTHTGSLPRSAELAALLVAHEEGQPAIDLGFYADEAIRQSVVMQRITGIDVINDGEQSKSGYSTYVRDRLSGFSGEPIVRPAANDLRAHPDFGDLKAMLVGRPSSAVPSCSGPISYSSVMPVQHDIECLLDAVAKANFEEDADLFMSAASPGLVALFFGNRFYPTEEEFLIAIADAMRTEYRAIVDAGIILQLDCPDLAMSHNSVFQDLTYDEFRREVELRIEVLNYALRDLPEEMLRMHVCWGNYESPHTTDVPLEEILELVLTARPAGLSLEAANPRHGHEWRLFEEVRLPDGKYVIPGVIDTTTNFVEHAEVVANRLLNYVEILGEERVVAGTDCGFNTFVGRNRVAPSVCWAKLQAMCEGSKLASKSK